MREALDSEVRTAILAIKREIKADPAYREAGVHSRSVYLAALEGVRTVGDFREWLEHQGVM